MNRTWQQRLDEQEMQKLQLLQDERAKQVRNHAGRFQRGGCSRLSYEAYS